LELEPVQLQNIAYGKVFQFKIDDYVVLKSGEYSMVVEGLIMDGELHKVICSWSNTSNEKQVETFYSTSLIPE
jgi:uncharacterized protein YodC (DUF2158 family)